LVEQNVQEKRTAAAQFQRKVTAVAHVREKMQSGKWQGVQVRDQGAPLRTISPSSFRRNVMPGPQRAWPPGSRDLEGLLRFTAHHQVTDG
jgi:hypothetical protein